MRIGQSISKREIFSLESIVLMNSVIKWSIIIYFLLDQMKPIVNIAHFHVIHRIHFAIEYGIVWIMDWMKSIVHLLFRVMIYEYLFLFQKDEHYCIRLININTDINMTCIHLDRIGNGTIDPIRGIDENLINICPRKYPIDLKKDFCCLNSSICIEPEQVCDGLIRDGHLKKIFFRSFLLNRDSFDRFDRSYLIERCFYLELFQRFEIRDRRDEHFCVPSRLSYEIVFLIVTKYQLLR